MPVLTDRDIPGRRGRGVRIARTLAVPLIVAGLTAGCTSAVHSEGRDNPTKTPSAQPIRPDIQNPYYVPTTTANPGELRTDATPIKYREIFTHAMITDPTQFQNQDVCFPVVTVDDAVRFPSDGTDASGNAIYGKRLAQLPAGPATGFLMELDPLTSTHQPDTSHMVGVYIPDGLPPRYTPYAVNATINALGTKRPSFTVCGNEVKLPASSSLGKFLREQNDNSGTLFVAEGVVVPQKALQGAAGSPVSFT